MNSMKALMISTFPPRRCGIGDYSADLAAQIAKRDRLELSVLTYNEGRGGPADAENGVEVSRRLDRKVSRSRMARLLLEANPDLVHLQSSSFLHHPSVNNALSQVCEVPLVTTVHDTPNSWRLFYTIPSLRRVYESTAGLITHAPHTTETLAEFHGVQMPRVTEIPHGVDTARYRPGVTQSEARERYSLEEELIVLYFGFLRPGKGLGVLLRAWSKIRHMHPEAVLMIAGGVPSVPKRYGASLQSESNYPRKLRRLARRLRIANQVTFTGYVPEELVPSLLAAAELVVLPYTRGPSQSGPLHKAVSSGKAVIGTRVLGFERLLGDGRNGMLVPPKDVDALAGAISALLDDETQRRRLGANARLMAERGLDWSRVATQTHRVYSQAMELGGQ